MNTTETSLLSVTLIFALSIPTVRASTSIVTPPFGSPSIGIAGPTTPYKNPTPSPSVIWIVVLSSSGSVGFDGTVNISINQRFPLEDVAKAHEALTGRSTTGCTVLTP